MYKAFDLTITIEELNSIIKKNPDEQIRIWKSIGWQKKQSFHTEYSNLIKRYISEGVLDGTSISAELFGCGHFDVFLSYSHNDEDLVFVLAGMLEEYFGLNVFVDAFYWGSADALLREIDDKYCKKPDGNYSYEMRNLSTSHVHAMLTTAIISVMDSSETLVFVNTDNSVPLLKNTLSEKKEYTFSPWIYEEALFTTFLREKQWFEYRPFRSDEKYDFEKKEWDIAYELPKDKMIPLNKNDIELWMCVHNQMEKLKRNKKIRTVEGIEMLFTYKIQHPLNYLYTLLEIEK